MAIVAVWQSACQPRFAPEGFVIVLSSFAVGATYPAAEHRMESTMFALFRPFLLMILLYGLFCLFGLWRGWKEQKRLQRRRAR